MAYLHCHNCDWAQDDFYHKGFNPASFLGHWDKYLFGARPDEIDRQFTNDSNFLREFGSLTVREVIARDFEKFAQNIRKMKWITFEQWRDEPNKVCPKCGSSELDID